VNFFGDSVGGECWLPAEVLMPDRLQLLWFRCHCFCRTGAGVLVSWWVR
jgi:hypothetical protein